MPSETTETVTNWARNITFSAERLHRPRSVEQVQELVKGSSQVRVLGSGHSFNRIADTTHTLLTLHDLPERMEIDESQPSVTVSAGLLYGAVAEFVQSHGWALHNLGSLPHISVAGACATGTHGSGEGNGTLASVVRAVEMVTADGALVTLRRGDADFPAAVVQVGAMGVVTALTLDLEPTFDVHQMVYDDADLDQVVSSLDEVYASAYSVSVFTNWREPVAQVWVKARAGEWGSIPDQWLGGHLADGMRHPVPGMRGESCTAQGGEPGPWHDRLPHFRLAFTPSNGDELQSEFFVVRADAQDAIAALREIGDEIAPIVQISEIRAIAQDEQWLSPSQGQETLAFHFTWHPDAEAVNRVVAQIEAQLAPYGARPHWGKVFTMTPEVVAQRYPRLHDFAAVARRYDPKGVFANDFVRDYIRQY